MDYWVKRIIKNMEGKTSFERVVGGTEEQKEAVRTELQKTYDVSDRKLSKYDIEKTPEDHRTYS